MKFQLVSDLHLDKYGNQDAWTQVLDHIIDLNADENADALIIAGDLAEIRHPVWSKAMQRLADAYPAVLMVLGNHEHYRTPLSQVEAAVKALPDHVHILDNDTVILDNHKIVGSTLWFSEWDVPAEEVFYFSDFRVIPNLDQWVYKYHQTAKQLLKMEDAELIITHHASHPNSIHTDFIGNKLNPFFMSDCTDIIELIQPKYWVHGHTHHPFHYKVEETTVLANPFAYPRERYWFCTQYPPCFFEL
jgi:Icc-related predicted phosphoesterase